MGVVRAVSGVVQARWWGWSRPVGGVVRARAGAPAGPLGSGVHMKDSVFGSGAGTMRMTAGSRDLVVGWVKGTQLPQGTLTQCVSS